MSIKTSYKKALNNKIFEVISQASQELNMESYVIGGLVYHPHCIRIIDRSCLRLCMVPYYFRVIKTEHDV